MRLVALNAEARKSGLTEGLTLADARARIPHLLIEQAAPERDARFLLHLARACGAFSPLVAVEPPDGLVLDVTGCLHLFGDESGLLHRIDSFLAHEGAEITAALAVTPDMARALARFGGARLAIARSERKVLALPVAALEAEADTTLALKRAGFRVIADLTARPSDLIAARFGMDLTEKLDRLLGRRDRRITPLRALPPYEADHRAAEPILNLETALRFLGALIVQIGQEMVRRGEGGRLFRVWFFRTDGKVQDLACETAAPSRDPAVIIRLLRSRLEALADPVDPGFGFDLIRLAVPRAEPFQEDAPGLDAAEDTGRAITGLLDRFVARFGAARVRVPLPLDRHMPEQAEAWVPALERWRDAQWERPSPGELPGRPLHLFAPPQPIDVVTEAPDARPIRFLWRRRPHEIRAAEGPERLAPPWWEEGTPRPTRDYYRLEDSEGRRFWVFRAWLPGGEVPPRWFLHGLFP